MKMIAWLMLAAAIVPFLSAILAKAGGQEVRQQRPASLAGAAGRLAGARQRGAEQCFEALPFFYAAVLFALHNQADATRVATLMACWLGLRLGYLAMYVAGWGAALAGLGDQHRLHHRHPVHRRRAGRRAAGASVGPARRHFHSKTACGAGALDGDLAFLRLALVGGRHLVSPAGSFTSMYGPSDVARSTGLPWPSCMATVTSAT